jgi:uncharacterized protein (DUF427 family)
MKAIWNNIIIAESDETIVIEGNHYFPPDSIKKKFFKSSELRTLCHWKGEASYYTIDVDGKVNKNGAWYYPAPKEGSAEQAGFEFKNYVAFWQGVKIID